MSNSRISGLHKLDIAARLDKLRELGWLSSADVALLKQGQQILRSPVADRMVENVIGVFGLPLAVAPNFIVNGREHIVPMVVEEPSVVAALSNAAKQARPDGFTATCDEWLLAGQIHITDVADVTASLTRLEGQKAELLEAANAVHPRLANYGGGVRDIAFQSIELASGMALAISIFVDTGNAMGANLVNTICEAVAPAINAICDGKVALRILTNLTDRSVVTAEVHYSLENLASNEFTGEQVRDGIVIASEIASADPYRAATHNKGIMNGVDAVAIATGNDWRAIEAGAHAYAAITGTYQPLAVWTVAEDGALRGRLEMPLRVATVGGTLHANNAARIALHMLAVESSRELAEVMAAAGLAQNFAALQALATDGIQKGHMRMHARSATPENFTAGQTLHDDPDGVAAGKVILLGEHAAVYGKHALAVPIPAAVSAKVVAREDEESAYVSKMLSFIKSKLEVENDIGGVDLRSTLPPGMGLGASAAMAVAIIRALNKAHELGLDDEAVNRVAFECEKIAHGTPSGIDNSIATYAMPLLFCSENEPALEVLTGHRFPPTVIALSSQRAATLEQVAGVRARYDAQPKQFAALFAEIDSLVVAAADALQAGDVIQLGSLMNICQGMLNAIGVSTPELESMLSIARSAGAAGAKLTGSGGGGSVVAVCADNSAAVSAAFEAAGYATITINDTENS